jgi:hypothetical protein
MMQRFFYRSLVLVLVGALFCGCSEKVETEEKKAVGEEEVKEVEEQVSEVDPVEAIIADKLSRIMIPRLDFEDRTVEEALDYIRLRIVELDQTESDPARKGMNMVIRRPKGDSDSKPIDENGQDLLGDDLGSERILELRVRNVSVAAALRYICMMTNLRCEVDGCLVISQKVPNSAWDDVGSLLEEKGDTTVISQKLSQIRLPRVDFENTSIHEVIDFLRLRSAELDVTSIDTGRKGINFVVYIPKGMETPYIDKLQMSDSSFEEVLKEICAKTGMRYELDPYSVILVPKDLK